MCLFPMGLEDRMPKFAGVVSAFCYVDSVEIFGSVFINSLYLIFGRTVMTVLMSMPFFSVFLFFVVLPTHASDHDQVIGYLFLLITNQLVGPPRQWALENESVGN